MKIKTGHQLLNNVTDVDSRGVRFVVGDDDERTMFEVEVGADGRSITVRAPETCFVDGVLYANRLQIEPQVSNSLTIRCPKYDE